MAFLVEQAGGQAFTGKERVMYCCPVHGFSAWYMLTDLHLTCITMCVKLFLIQALEIVPTKIHQRSPIFLGSYEDVEEVKRLYGAA